MPARPVPAVAIVLVLGAGLAVQACATQVGGEGGSGPRAGAASVAGPQRARVQRVVDGDTLKVRLADGRRRTVRVLGIDTPETKKPDTPVECGGPQATAAMVRMAMRGSGYGARGRDVVLVSDPSGDLVDRYGRLLRYVDAGGTDLGGEQVSAGLAEVFAYRDRHFARRAAYERAERAARDARRGAWGACGGDFHSAR